MAACLASILSVSAVHAEDGAKAERPRNEQFEKMREGAERRAKNREERKLRELEALKAIKARREAKKQEREAKRTASVPTEAVVEEKIGARRQAWRAAVAERRERIRKLIETHEQQPEQALVEWQKSRDLRRIQHLDAVRRVWEDSLRGSIVRAEFELHGWRMARLDRARFLALTGKHTKLLERVEALTDREEKRHEEQLEALADRAAMIQSARERRAQASTE